MINRALVESRLSLILDLIRQLDSLAGCPEVRFVEEPRNVAAAESFLRRALEALLDVGRHLLAKSGHSDLAREYKTTPRVWGPWEWSQVTLCPHSLGWQVTETAWTISITK